jgi:transposase
VQQTVAQLGELDGEGRARAEALARSITGRGSEFYQGQLFNRIEPTDSVAVKLDRVRLERSRSFGVVWLGWILWRALKLDELCGALLACKRETVPWSEVIAILVIGRLCEPSSELHVAERWYRTTALEDLLGVAVADIYDERLYRALDRLLPHKETIEKHLVQRLGELFKLDYDLLLYDITSTYFEGVADPAIAKRGYSRDHRPDCVQVNIALVVSREGMPLGYEIFVGNTTDVTTVQQIVQSMEDRFGKVNRVWVMDRGMVSAENIAWFSSTGRRYVIGTARAELGRFAKQLAVKTDWRQLREDIEVKICRGPDGSETFLLCRSASRSEKEQAMHERFSKRIEEGLQSLGRRIEKSQSGAGRIGTPDRAAFGAKRSRLGALLDLSDRR